MITKKIYGVINLMILIWYHNIKEFFLLKLKLFDSSIYKMETILRQKEYATSYT